jgi:3-hydroxymyristoyl/3-hydroxydecanoyl-(acyl carrier protein) dehydratase
MTKLFPLAELQRHTAQQVQIQLQVSADILYFAGHFPGAPVLAGVTQLHWAIHYCKHYFPALAEVTSVEVLKFQRMIKPGDQLTLQLELSTEQTMLFTYLMHEQKVASGRLKWSLQPNA